MRAGSHNDRFDVRAGLFFAAVALALTWPLAFSPGAAVSVRDDDYPNLWNAWRLGRALNEGVGPPLHEDDEVVVFDGHGAP